MPCENLALYSYIFTPRKTPPRISVTVIQAWPAPALLARAHSSASTMLTLEQISTNVLKAPMGSLRCTSCGRGQAGAPNRSTMYVADQPAKNMISVDRNSHTINLPFGSGKPG